MSTRAAIVAAARGWIGTPYMHQQRMRGVGIDCAGLVIAVARECGLVDEGFDLTGYAMQPDGSLLGITDAHMCRVAAPQPGDVAVFRIEHEPQHLGIVADYVHGGLSVIHALDQRGHKRGRVVEHRIDDEWRSRIVAAYALPGVA